MSCECAADWRLDILNLADGERLGSLPFLSFEFEEILNQVGAASIVVPVRKVTMLDIWPHLRAVAFTRISGPDATESRPVVEFVGMIESVSAVSEGTVTIGLQSIEHYLSYRILVNDYDSGDTYQTLIGSDLVDLAASDGIPLAGAFEISAFSKERIYMGSDDKVILEAIQELTQSSDGPDYIREYTRTPTGTVSTVLRFVDYAGSEEAPTITDRRGLVTYGIEIDGTQHTNWVRGRGDETVSPYTADTLSGSLYPRFDKAVQYSDVTLDQTVIENVDGELVNNADPTAVPDITIADLNISVPINLGDWITLKMDHGAIRFLGVARVVGKAWRLEPEAPTSCTISFVPLSSVSSAVLNAPAGTGSGCC